jgi:hypothetical protein
VTAQPITPKPQTPKTPLFKSEWLINRGSINKSGTCSYNLYMKNKENKVSETQPEKKRVAATLEGAQPRPNASAAQTALQIG